MRKAKQNLYVHAATGDIMQATAKQAKGLDKAWSKIQFIKNEAGKAIMRFNLNGATVDVEANEDDIREKVTDVNPVTS